MIALLKNWKILLGGGVVIFLVLAYLWIDYKAYSKGYRDCEMDNIKAKQEEIEKRETLEREITIMPKEEIRKRLEDKWCRDCS